MTPKDPSGLGNSCLMLLQSVSDERYRKKLQPFEQTQPRSAQSHHVQGLTISNGRTQSMSPWADPKELGATNLDGKRSGIPIDDRTANIASSDDTRWGDDSTEDKNRRIRHELEPDDVIQDVQTVTRIVGVDASRKLAGQFKWVLALDHALLFQLDCSSSEGRTYICSKAWCKTAIKRSSMPVTRLRMSYPSLVRFWTLK